MIIGDTANMEKSNLAKLFELKAEINEVIMHGGHNNCSTHSTADEKYFTRSKIFGGHFLFDLVQNLISNISIERSRQGIKI